MTDPRVTILYAFEDTFAVAPTQTKWLIPPPGSWFTSSHSQETERINAVTDKKWSDMDYGKISGTWQWQFYLDYEFIEPLRAAFDTYEYTSSITGVGEHTFSKSESRTVPSFTVVRKQLNTLTGGKDEISYLYGCVCNSLRFSQQAGQSQITVNMSGIYSKESVATATLTGGLDKVERDYNMVQFSCAYVDKGSDSVWGKVSAWSLQVQNNVRGIYSVGNPHIRSYYEGQTSNLFSIYLYSDNPEMLRMRTMSGGCTPERVPRYGASAPIEHIELRSTDSGEVITVDDTEIGVQRTMTVDIEDCVVNEMTWNSGESVIYDQLSNGKCRDISVKIVNRFPYPYDVLPATDAELNAWDDHWTEIGEVE